MIGQMLRIALLPAALCLAGPAVAQTAQTAPAARQSILTTGSSTVYPFTAAVAERFAAQPGHKPPTVISTGTVHGFNRFCQGKGLTHPDIQSASRRMNGTEFSMCAKNGVNEIMELPIGYDGIVLVVRKGAPPVFLSRQQIWTAVAKEVPSGGRLVPNPHTRWAQIDPKLPDWPIEVLGPPRTSGTRDSFVDMVMLSGCQAYAEVRAIPDIGRQRAVCATVREDGRWIDSGEDDTRIVARLVEAPVGLVGVLGYSFLAENADRLEGIVVEGVRPTADDIASGRYPLARPLFLYVKRPNIKLVPGLAAFLADYASEAAMGPSGYLLARGLVPLEARQRERLRADIEAGTIMLRRPGS
jgi:phosphate transport system substrate-binding protein